MNDHAAINEMRRQIEDLTKRVAELEKGNFPVAALAAGFREAATGGLITAGTECPYIDGDRVKPFVICTPVEPTERIEMTKRMD